MMPILENNLLFAGTPCHPASMLGLSYLNFRTVSSSCSVKCKTFPSLFLASATFGLKDDLQPPNLRRRSRGLQFVLSATQPEEDNESPENLAPPVEISVRDHGNDNNNANGDGSRGSKSHCGQASTRRSSPSPVSNEHPSPPLDILYRDQHIAAICKPPLIHVHRPEFGSKDKEFVLQKARNQLGARVYFPHRLDRGTSGCLLMGFSPEASKALHRALSDERSSKTYVAIVRGSGEAYIGRGWFAVDRPIKDEKKVLREASTRFLFVAGGQEPGPRCCLVLAQPSTGRFHQIRRHLNGLNHPVVGDSVHGSSPFNRGIVREHGAPVGRLLLHCLRIELPTLPQPGTERWYRQEEYVDKHDSRRDDRPIHNADKAQSTTDRGWSVRTGERARQEKSGASCTAESSRRSRNLPGRGGGVDGCQSNNGSHGDFGTGSDGEDSAGLGDDEAVELPSDDANVKFVGFRSGSVGLRGRELDLASVAVAGLPAHLLEQRANGNICGDSGCLARDVDDDGDEGGHGSEAVSSLDIVEVEGVDSCKGLNVWCSPPDDFMDFLRGVPWWEEGLLEAAAKRK